LTNQFTYGQDVNSIIASYYQAIGGKTLIDSIQTITAKTRNIDPFANYLSTLSLKRDYKYRVETSYEDGRHSVNCLNGSEYSGSNKMVAEMLAAHPNKLQHIFVINELLFTPVSELQQEPSEFINDIKCHVLSYHDVEWERSYKYYFDVNTYLLVAESNNLHSKLYSERTLYENYQSVEGILFPMRSVIINEMGEHITDYTEIILNPELPDDIFECDSK
jgi:hypothetical protein